MKIFIGKRAEEMRGILRLAWPMDHGVVTDWDDMERIWHHLFMKEMQVCVCAHACVHACVHVCMCAYVHVCVPHSTLPGELAWSPVTIRSS